MQAWRRLAWRLRPGGPAAGAPRFILEARAAVDGEAVRAVADVGREQPGGLQFASAAGCASEAGEQRAVCAAMGLRKLRPFFVSHGQPIGFRCEAKIAREDLAGRLHRATGAEPRLIPGGPAVCRRIGIVTGGAGGEVEQAAAEGNRHLHHGGRAALDLCAGGGARHQCVLWRSLCDGDVWGEERWPGSFRESSGCRGRFSTIRRGCDPRMSRMGANYG